MTPWKKKSENFWTCHGSWSRTTNAAVNMMGAVSPATRAMASTEEVRMPGILTSSVLSIARVAGETAPIMFTAAFVVRDQLPWQVQKFSEFFFQGVMALPYHIYVVASKIPQNEYTRDVQYGTAFVFLFTVASIAMTAVVLRQRLRKKYKW